MTKRPSAHKNEDIARSLLGKAFAAVGWTVNDLHKDYGEDLLVRIFQNNKATPYSFYVQSKSVRNTSKRIAENGLSISQRISLSHLYSWFSIREPVILAVMDIQREITYWECVQNNFMCRNAVETPTTQQKAITVSVPLQNRLDQDGLKKIAAISKSMYDTAKYERLGLKALVQSLQSQYGLTVNCATDLGILVMPPGEFHEKQKTNPIIIAFGSRGKWSSQILKDDQRDVTNSINKGEAIRQAFKTILFKEGRIPLLDPKTGKAMQEITTINEYDKACAELLEKHMCKQCH